MVIGEERHAAALKGKDGDWLLFDDTGEMIATAQESAGEERTAWVHDFEQLSWIEANDAVFVWLPDGKTPMGTGIIAYADAVRADAKATAVGGWKKTWTEMLSDWSMS
jgi:copper chaperone NosL